MVKNQNMISPFCDVRTENKQRTLVMYSVANEMVIGCNFDFDIVVILT